MTIKDLDTMDLFYLTENNPHKRNGEKHLLMLTEKHESNNTAEFVPINKKGDIIGCGWWSDMGLQVLKADNAWDKYPDKYKDWYNWTADYQKHHKLQKQAS